MTTTEILTPATDSAERAKGIGGSDIPVILGLSPYKTPLDLYLQKRGLWEDEFESEAAHWGSVMEPVLAREYVRRYEIPVLRREHGYDVSIGPEYDIVQNPEEPWGILGTLTHPKYPWARGHVDGIGLAETGAPSHVCEFKTADLRLSGFWGDPDTDQVPEHYLAQVQWYLELADLELGHLAVLIGGNRFARYIIPRDQVLIGLMLERAAEFWERVQTQNPPAPEPGERGKQSLARLYPKGALGKEIDATPELLRATRILHGLREEAKSLDGEKTTAENEIKLVMADAVRLNLGPKSYISWKNNKDSVKTDWEAAFHDLARTLAQESPALVPEVVEGTIALHTTMTPGSRVFRCQGLDKLEV